MKERPILFSGDMVRAILDGRKTQTRRAVKHHITGPNPPSCFFDWHHQKTGAWIGAHGGGLEFGKTNAASLCQYGQPGDRLWVREAFMLIDNRDGGRHIRYKACGPDFVFRVGFGDDDWRGASKWTPSIHMRREYSRILLEITSVRVERVQEISEDDAFAEGTTPSIIGHALDHLKYRAGFQTLWELINAARGYGWDVNPWVWVINFKRID